MVLIKARIVDDYFNQEAKLPYGLEIDEIKKAMIITYDFLFDLNTFLLKKGYTRIEDMVLGNSLSGLLSEIIVKNVSINSKTLTRNRKIGGHPDLILRGKHKDDSVLHDSEGIEIKTSKQAGGWQGHNPEDCWLMIFRYNLDESNKQPLVRGPIEFVQVLVANIKTEDWSFSGRSGNSRRTITASITSSGMHKLRGNPIYQNPKYIVNQRD